MTHGHTDWRIEPLPGWGNRPNATAIALFRERLCLAADQTVYMSQSGAFENFALTKKYIPSVDISMDSSGFLTLVASAGIVEMLWFDHIRLHATFLVDEVEFERVNNWHIIVRPKDGIGGLSRFGVIVDHNPGGHRVTPDSVAGVIRVDAGGTFAFDPSKGSIERDNSVDTGYIVRPASDIIAADDPLEINVYSEQMDRIEWLCPSSGLLVGTSGGEFVINKTTTVDPLGPENIEVVPETSFGSSAIQALRIGAVVMFVQRAGRRVREFAYDYAGDNYLAMDLTVAAEHITAGGLTSLVWQSEPIETLWAARSDGQLIGFTYSKDQDMTAWHRHQLGGGGQVKHLAVIPAAHGGRDELWLSVQRRVGGQVVHSIERMEPGHEYGADLREAFFVDAGLTLRGSGLTEISGLDHLEGLEVAVLGDGAPQRNKVVSGGRISLDHPLNIVHVGLPFESRLATVNMDMQLQDGSVQTRLKRFNKVALRLLESLGGAAGPRLDRLEQLEFRKGNDRMDAAVPLFSGDRLLNWPGGWEKEGSLTVVQTYPLPFTLTAIVPLVNVDGLN